MAKSEKAQNFKPELVDTGDVSNYDARHLFTTPDGIYTSLGGDVWGGNIIGVFYEKPNSILVDAGIKYDSARTASGITLYL